MRFVAWVPVLWIVTGCWNSRSVYDPPVGTDLDTVPRELRMHGTVGSGYTPTLVVTTERGRVEVAAITLTHDTTSEPLTACGPWQKAPEAPLWQCQHQWLDESPDARALLAGLDSLIAAMPARRAPNVWCDGGVHWTLEVKAEGRTWRLQSLQGSGELCWPTDSLGRAYNRRGAELLWGALEGLDAMRPAEGSERE